MFPPLLCSILGALRGERVALAVTAMLHLPDLVLAKPESVVW